MKSKIPAKIESKWKVAQKLASHYSVSPEGVIGWFNDGCPQDFEEGKKWKDSRLEASKIRTGRGGALSKLEKARQEAARANEEVNWDILSPDLQAVVDVTCELYLAGYTPSKITSIIGISAEVAMRIISLHPRTKDKEREVSTNAWADIRRLAQGELRDRLSDPIERAKIKPGDLNFLAGTAHDKLKDSEGPKEVTLNIKARIEAIPYEELLKMLPDKNDVIEGEFEVQAPETNLVERAPEIKTPARPPKKGSDSQQPTPAIETDNV